MQQTAGICVVSLQLANAALDQRCGCVYWCKWMCSDTTDLQESPNKKAFLQPCPAASCRRLPEPKMSSAAWVDFPALKTSLPALKTSNPDQLVPIEANVIMSMVFTAS